MTAMALTIGRLFLAAGFVIVVAVAAARGPLTWGWAAALLAIALAEELTDLFDGMAARRFNTVTRLGGILDPLSDSLSRLAIYFAIALAGWVTIAVPLVMAGRDVIVSYTRIVQALTGGKTSARLSGKLKAVIQGAGIGALVVLAAWRDASLCSGGAEVASSLMMARHIAAGLIVLVTLWSLFDYLRGALPGVRQLARES